MNTKYSSTEFALLVQAVASDLVEATLHFHLYRKLTAAVADHAREFHQAPTFWNLTLVAHRDAWILRLCRAYDPQSRALSLPRWLRLIQEHLPLFDQESFRERLKDNPFVASLAETARKPDVTRLTEDIKAVSVATNDRVKRLQVLRNNVFAHTSIPKALDHKAIWLKGSLTMAEVEELLTLGVDVLNRYSSLFQALTFATKMPGADDYAYILKAVSRDLERQEEEFQREMDEISRANTKSGGLTSA